MPNWFIVLPTICFGFIILTSLVIFIFVRLGRRIISGVNSVGSALDDEPALDQIDGARWTDGGHASRQLEPITQSMRSCPACGGESPASSPVCDYCSRPF
jgi:hypothetical protein